MYMQHRNSLIEENDLHRPFIIISVLFLCIRMTLLVSLEKRRENWRKRFMLLCKRRGELALPSQKQRKGHLVKNHHQSLEHQLAEVTFQPARLSTVLIPQPLQQLPLMRAVRILSCPQQAQQANQKSMFCYGQCPVAVVRFLLLIWRKLLMS